MNIYAGGERALDLLLVEVQARAEKEFEQYDAEMKGRRVAHIAARPHPQAPPSGTQAAQAQLQPPTPPSTLTPKAGGY